ncbi:MAG: tetraacyldisaccharide 4'-kinase, partial [Bdellovibrionales bacterium]|nr:tetraacyldisaccharide 4'-kinase [Bdellovibrionales bacterium]
MDIRNWLFDNKVFSIYKSNLPVICVGNLSAGGNGKTPLVRMIVSELQKIGMQPVVVSRGYGGKIKGPYKVSVSDTPIDVGDEALIYAGDGVPTVIGRSRVAAVKFVESNKVGNVVVLDDGFQHRWLARDLNIVTVNCATDSDVEAFLVGHLLPLGRFRENRDRALSRADMIVFARRSLSDGDGDIDPRLVPFGKKVGLYYSSAFSAPRFISI